MNESKLRVPHTAGYRTVGKKQLDTIVLPSKITCRLCNKSKKPEYGFSAKALDAFRNGVATRQITQATEDRPWWIACRDCGGKQRTEMLCSQCQYWKALDGFTKAQRKTPDNPLCMQCVYDNQTAPPILGSGHDSLRDPSDDDDDDDDDGSVSNVHSQSGLADSDAGVRVSEASSHHLNEENLKHVPSVTSQTKAWQTYARSGNATGRKFTAYDAQGRAHEKVHTPSVADTEESYATTRASRVTDREMKDLTSKFARQRGPRQELVAPAPYVGGRAGSIEDDPDSDDSYGYI